MADIVDNKNTPLNYMTYLKWVTGTLQPGILGNIKVSVKINLNFKILNID